MGADPNDAEGLHARGPAGTNFLKAAAGLLAALALIALFAVLFRQALGGQSLGADYYIYWNAGRALLQHQDPYGPETALSTQLAITRHMSNPGEDPLAFNYPLYSLLGIAPTLWMSFSWAQPLWMAANLVLLLAFTVLGLRRPPLWLLAGLPFVYNFAYGMILGNFSLPLFAFFLLCYGYFLLHSGRDRLIQGLAGILLAWCTIKPQYAWAYLGFLLVLALRRRLWTLLVSFGVSLALFLGISFLAMPGWLSSWLGKVGAYASTFTYNRSLSHVAGLLFPPSLNTTGGYLILALALAVVVYQFQAWWRGRASSLQVLAWLSTITFLLLPSNQSSEQTILFIPVMLWICGPERPRLGWVVWAGLFASSYAGFILSQSKVFPDGVQVLVFLAFLAWVAGLEISGIFRRRAAPSKNAT